MIWFIFGGVIGVLAVRMSKPLLVWYLKKESEIKNDLEK